MEWERPRQTKGNGEPAGGAGLRGGGKQSPARSGGWAGGTQVELEPAKF